MKNNFSKVVIGLSGGIDSSLTAAIAVDALGAKNVVGITMPSKFNSPETIKDAQMLADNLDIEFYSVPIETVLDKFNSLFGKFDKWTTDGLAYENLQARIRGCILMSLSNQYGYLVLTTSNKSETAVGYATLYGDLITTSKRMGGVLNGKELWLSRNKTSLLLSIPNYLPFRQGKTAIMNVIYSNNFT